MHKQTSLEKYSEKLCGKTVTVISGIGPDTHGVVERVVLGPRGYPMVILENEPERLWKIKDMETVEADFTVGLNCPNCEGLGTLKAISHGGKYQCNRCREYFEFDDDYNLQSAPHLAS